jgi:RNA-dependent RNA polymerase
MSRFTDALGSRDMFSVICYGPLLPNTFEDAASYESFGTKELDRDSTVEDICDFVVEYINSDVLVRQILLCNWSD